MQSDKKSLLNKKIKLVLPPMISRRSIRDLLIAEPVSKFKKSKNRFEDLPRVVKDLHLIIKDADPLKRLESDANTINVLMPYRAILSSQRALDDKRCQKYFSFLKDLCYQENWQQNIELSLNFGRNLEKLSAEDEYDLLLAIYSLFSHPRIDDYINKDFLYRLIKQILPDEYVEAINLILSQAKTKGHEGKNYVDLVDTNILESQGRGIHNNIPEKYGSVFYQIQGLNGPGVALINGNGSDALKISHTEMHDRPQYLRREASLFVAAEESWSFVRKDKGHPDYKKDDFSVQTFTGAKLIRSKTTSLDTAALSDPSSKTVPYLWFAMIGTDITLKENQETHGDVKPGNIHFYYDENTETGRRELHVELFDWKNARKDQKYAKLLALNKTYESGTEFYALSHYYKYDPKRIKTSDFDTFAFGISLIELLSNNDDEIMEYILQEERPNLRKPDEQNLDYLLKSDEFRSIDHVTDDLVNLIRDMTSCPPISLELAIKQLHKLYRDEISNTIKDLSSQDRSELKNYLNRIY